MGAGAGRGGGGGGAGAVHAETMGPPSTGTERVTRNLIKVTELNIQEIEVSTDNTHLLTRTL